tara:strand:+ start:1705 stop:3114 length:1410 start_codon:yes stop_codon:yes gene_type:complete
MLKKHSLFFKKLEKFKNKKALIIKRNKFITYKKLILDSKKISRHLEEKKKLVFLLGQNNLETIAGYISFIDKGYAVALLDFRLNQLFFKKLVNLYKPDYIYCEEKCKKNLNLYKPILNYKKYVLLKRKGNKQNLLHKDLMLLMSTSGTTGSPKFVRLSYSNVVSNTEKIINYLRIKHKDITITSLPISYVYGLSVINSHLLSGATIALTNKSMIEKKFWKIIKECKITNFSGVPYNYLIIEKIIKQSFPKSIKYTTQAGGKMDHRLIKNIIKIYKKRKIKLIQMYGAAEATARMSYLKWNYAEKKIGSIGKPIPGGKFYIIDKNKRKIKKKFRKGELVYEGKNVFMGYAKNLKDLALPDLNKGILKTGDIAYEDKDGFFYIVGRKNRYVKIFGIRLNLSELEAILLEKGIDVTTREGGENKINIYFKNPSQADKGLKYISKITSINQNVFVNRKITNKNLTANFKYKIK